MFLACSVLRLRGSRQDLRAGATFPALGPTGIDALPTRIDQDSAALDSAGQHSPQTCVLASRAQQPIALNLCLCTHLHRCLCICLYICLHTRLHTCLHTCVQISTHMSTCKSTHMSTHMSAHMSACMHAHKSTHVCTHMSAHMYTCMSMHMSTHMPACISAHLFIAVYQRTLNWIARSDLAFDSGTEL